MKKIIKIFELTKDNCLKLDKSYLIGFQIKKQKEKELKKWEEICYNEKHKRIKKILLKPDTCICGESENLILHNLSGKYNDDINDWIWLCRSCHLKFHGRIIYLSKDKDIKDVKILKDILDIK